MGLGMRQFEHVNGTICGIIFCSSNFKRAWGWEHGEGGVETLFFSSIFGLIFQKNQDFMSVFLW